MKREVTLRADQWLLIHNILGNLTKGSVAQHEERRQLWRLTQFTMEERKMVGWRQVERSTNGRYTLDQTIAMGDVMVTRRLTRAQCQAIATTLTNPELVEWSIATEEEIVYPMLEKFGWKRPEPTVLEEIDDEPEADDERA